MDVQVASGFDQQFDLEWSFFTRALDFPSPRHAFIVTVEGMSGGGGGAYDLSRSADGQGWPHNILSLSEDLVAVTGIAPRGDSVDVRLVRRSGETGAGHHVQIAGSKVDGFLCICRHDGVAVRLAWNSQEIEIPIDLYKIGAVT